MFCDGNIALHVERAAEHLLLLLLLLLLHATDGHAACNTHTHAQRHTDAVAGLTGVCQYVATTRHRHWRRVAQCLVSSRLVSSGLDSIRQLPACLACLGESTLNSSFKWCRSHWQHLAQHQLKLQQHEAAWGRTCGRQNVPSQINCFVSCLSPLAACGSHKRQQSKAVCFDFFFFILTLPPAIDKFPNAIKKALHATSQASRPCNRPNRWWPPQNRARTDCPTLPSRLAAAAV